MNKISRWAIYNPVPTAVLFVLLMLAGLYTYGKLRINNNPDIDIPTVTVTVAQAGASATELSTDVTEIIENSVAAISNVDKVNSTVSEGSSVTSISFLLGTDIDRATNDVQAAVNGVTSNLPAAATSPVVKRVEDTGQPILNYTVESDTKSLEEITWYVDDALARRLLTASGVSSIKRSGGLDRAVIVKLDPDRLSALGTSATEVSQTLATVNVNKPGGRLTVGDREQTIRTLASVSSLESLRNTNISLSGGRQVRLGDLGTVEDKWTEPRQRARLNGKEVVAFGVFRAVGTSEVAAAAAVRAVVAKIQAENGPYKITEISSSTTFVIESYEAAIEALIIGALLAVGIVYLFLRDIRATLISAIAMPMSLIPSFAIMWYLNLSLNNITLLALSLVVGILVDDAIVEIENIVRHMRMNKSGAFSASKEAADEIGLAVVATTGTLVAVFMPVAFMPGIPGQFFKSFAIVVSVSVLFSLLVARMLTPLMSAYLLKKSPDHDDTPKWLPTYLAVLRAALRFRWVTLMIGIAFFAGSVYLATKLPSEFFPAADRGQTSVSVELPPGATLDETDAVVTKVANVLAGQPEIANIYSSVGTSRSAGFGGQISTSGAVNTGSVAIILTPKAERKRSQQQFEADNARLLAAIPGARVKFSAGGLSSNSISITLVSNDQKALDETSETLREQMAGVAGLTNVVSTNAAAKPELIIVPNLIKAAEIGVSPSSISSFVNIATLGDRSSALAKFSLNDRQVSILVTLDPAAFNTLDRLSLLPISGTNGVVPLSAIADITFGAGPSTISRVNRTVQSTIRGDLNGLTLGDANQLVSALPILQSLPPTVSRLDQGDLQRLNELFSSFGVAMISGVLLMYFTLVLLFRNFLQPVTILTALPLSLGGALGFLFLADKAMGITVLIGLLMLMGIAAKNSILLVEYAIVEQRGGANRIDALMDAAAKRARPIIMTSIAMAAGMLPIATGFGADSESRMPMGIAVIGGLFSSTLLSLVYVPVVYTIMDDINNLLGRFFGRFIQVPTDEEYRDSEMSHAE
jgi:hydrophobe/amphiphile efflux-1 (HAE1) family protein